MISLIPGKFFPGIFFCQNQMSESMFDKLGELLNNAIKTGDFSTREKNAENSSLNNGAQKKDGSGSNNTRNIVHKNRHLNKTLDDCIASDVKKSIKYAQKEVRDACDFLNITDEMNYSEAKKQFHKKLKRFHPDKNNENEVMNKITKEKTEKILTSWEIVENWFKN